MLSWGDPHKPAILLLHGFLGTPHEWDEVATQLSDSYYCLAPALPGHAGRAPQANDFSGLAVELWEQISTSLPNRFTLLGYSLGGRLAMEMARQLANSLSAESTVRVNRAPPGKLPPEEPQYLSALVLEGAHPGLQDAEHRRLRRTHDESWARHFEQQPWRQALYDWYHQPVFASLDEQQRAALVERRAQHNPLHLAAVLRSASLAGQPQMSAMLSALNIPVTFITGGKDDKFTAVGEELAAINPQLRLVKLPEVGHNCHAEAPELIAKELRSLLGHICQP